METDEETASESEVVGEMIFTVGASLSIVMFRISLFVFPAESSTVTETESGALSG